MVRLILEENGLLNFIKNEVPEPEEAKAKEKHKKDVIRAKRIIVDSIKDHLILIVSYKDRLKEMYDALSRLYEGKNINREMNLRNTMKNIKMAKGESVHDYFSRVHQLKE